MTETNTNFYEVFGAILCGRCVCGNRIWLSEGEVYKRLPDCDLKTLIDDITTWLTENKDRIDEVFTEYNTMKKTGNIVRPMPLHMLMIMTPMTNAIWANLVP